MPLKRQFNEQELLELNLLLNDSAPHDWESLVKTFAADHGVLLFSSEVRDIITFGELERLSPDE